MGSLPGHPATAPQYTVSTTIIQAYFWLRESGSLNSSLGFSRTQRWGIFCLSYVDPGFPFVLYWVELMLRQYAGFMRQHGGGVCFSHGGRV